MKYIKGYTQTKKGFQAQISINGRTQPIGIFKTATEAHAAFIEERKKFPPQTRKKTPANAGLPIGVTRARSGNGRFCACITIDARNHYLGTYDSVKEAEAAFKKGKKAREQWQKQLERFNNR